MRIFKLIGTARRNDVIVIHNSHHPRRQRDRFALQTIRRAFAVPPFMVMRHHFQGVRQIKIVRMILHKHTDRIAPGNRMFCIEFYFRRHRRLWVARSARARKLDILVFLQIAVGKRQQSHVMQGRAARYRVDIACGKAALAGRHRGGQDAHITGNALGMPGKLRAAAAV